MAELEPGSNPIQDVADDGVPVSTKQRPGDPDAQIQEVAPLNRYGRLPGTSIAKVAPRKVALTTGDTEPQLALGADETRTGLLIFWQEGNGIVLIGYSDFAGDLAAFRENALPWLSTIPFRDDWLGPVYVALPEVGAVDTNIYVQPK